MRTTTFLASAALTEEYEGVPEVYVPCPYSGTWVLLLLYCPPPCMTLTRRPFNPIISLIFHDPHTNTPSFASRPTIIPLALRPKLPRDVPLLQFLVANKSSLRQPCPLNSASPSLALTANAVTSLPEPCYWPDLSASCERRLKQVAPVSVAP